MMLFYFSQSCAAPDNHNCRSTHNSCCYGINHFWHCQSQAKMNTFFLIQNLFVYLMQCVTSLPNCITADSYIFRLNYLQDCNVICVYILLFPYAIITTVSSSLIRASYVRVRGFFFSCGERRPLTKRSGCSSHSIDSLYIIRVFTADKLQGAY